MAIERILQNRVSDGRVTFVVRRVARPGHALRTVVLLLAFAAVLGAGVYGATQLMSLGGKSAGAVFSTFTVEPGEILVTVTEDGNVESADNIDIKCKVAGGTSILWIVEDGKEVQQGDKLVELDSAMIEDQVGSQKILVGKARAAMIQAEKNLVVAEITLKEYLEGTYLQELETTETQITIAEENLRSSRNALDYAKRMFQRGYISKLELESQEFSVKRSELELSSSKTAKNVLEQFTRSKTVEDLGSQIETAKAAMQSEQAAFELEQAKLERLETQAKNCEIFAPQDGMVVYANEASSRGQQSVTIEEGAAVRDLQTILRLPDLSKMQVKVTVHESRVEELRPGMRARISIQGRELQGNVVSVANQPEAASWYQGNVKEYATIVSIDNPPEAIRPGMTAEVEILVAHLKDVLSVPVSAVVEQRGEFFCWATTPTGQAERRQMTLGMTNERFVVVEKGLVQGEQVVRNPRSVVDEARADTVEMETVDVQDKFGDERPTPPGGGGQQPAGKPQGRLGRGGGPGGPPAGPGGGSGAGRSFNLMNLDTDGDGKISKQEAPERMRESFDRLDGNGDGFLDTQEASAIRRPRPGGGAGGPPNG